jgi:2-polyprenyl-3-methyl-5-hydroxy-6-metoxy-1,4-benzoquinol methylase
MTETNSNATTETNPWPVWHAPKTCMPLRTSGDELLADDEAGNNVAIIKGIPRFVRNEAYTAAFGDQWKRFRLTQLDSHTSTTITRDRLYRCFGDDLWSSLDGKHVLECGCGAGRFTEVLLDQRAYVTSIDLSNAVEANQENFPQDDHHRIAQADILELPFAPGQFDVVVCLGVIQHTPDPEKTIIQLAKHVKNGGWLVIDHYTLGISDYTKFGALVLRPILKRLSANQRFKIIDRLVALFMPFHRIARYFRPAQIILSRLSPLYTYYGSYPELNHKLQREWAMLDTHDALTDWFKHFRSRNQIQNTLESMGFTSTWCEYGGNGVEARARR